MKKSILSIIAASYSLVQTFTLSASNLEKSLDPKHDVSHGVSSEIAKKAMPDSVQLGENFLLSLNSAEQVKKDLLESKTTGPNARYTIGERSITPTIKTVEKILQGDFQLTLEELKNFLICVAANEQIPLEYSKLEKTRALIFLRHELVGMEWEEPLYKLAENENVRLLCISTSQRLNCTYRSGASGKLDAINLKEAFEKWLEHYFSNKR